jgi:hypothetical protein
LSGLSEPVTGFPLWRPSGWATDALTRRA